MMDDKLRQLLTQIDPMPPDVSVDAPDSTRKRPLLEEIMSTPVDTAPSTNDEPRPVGRSGRGHLTLLVSVVAAAAIAAIAITMVVIRDDDPPSRQALTIAAPGTTMSSCVPFDVNVLAEMPVAFAGTVTEISESTATVEVDRWYRASVETDLVDVVLPAENTSAALDGVELATGQRYLLTATDGTVNGCGFSGLATRELESAFNSAFSG